MKKIAFLIICLGLSLFAGETRSLIGIDAGYGQFTYSANDGRDDLSEDVGMIGLKLGAENESWRVFVEGRYFAITDAFDYANTLGVSLQYLIPVGDSFNFFLGANAGLVSLKFADNGINKAYAFSDPYFGGDIGFNVHVTDNVDWELAGRYMNIDAKNTQYTNVNNPNSGRTYTVEDMINAYTSIIIKFSN